MLEGNTEFLGFEREVFRKQAPEFAQILREVTVVVDGFDQCRHQAVIALGQFRKPQLPAQMRAQIQGLGFTLGIFAILVIARGAAEVPGFLG